MPVYFSDILSNGPCPTVSIFDVAKHSVCEEKHIQGARYFLKITEVLIIKDEAKRLKLWELGPMVMKLNIEE